MREIEASQMKIDSEKYRANRRNVENLDFMATISPRNQQQEKYTAEIRNAICEGDQQVFMVLLSVAYFADTLEEIMEKKKYYLVSAEALPEVFIKVAEAKRMLQVGEAATVGEAARMVGISRSAFYKYKDAVRPFQDMLHGRIVTFQIMLKDEPGILSHVLNLFAGSGANILTINQGLPINGCAVVTVNAETSGLQGSLQDLLARLDGADGVLRSEVLAG